MKNLFFAVALMAAVIPAGAADIGISVNIGQPGFYGQIDIGDYSQPQLVYRQPVMIRRGPVGRPPVYLNVPPGHAKNWRKHCGRYNACGERVFFVKNSWYDREYVPQYQNRHRGDDGRDGRDDRDGRDGRPDDPRGSDKNDRHDGNRDHGRGR